MYEPNDTELLVARVIGRDDQPDDWRRLHERARTDPAIWGQLAEGLEDDMLVRSALRERGDPAASVELPPAPIGRRLRHAGWFAAAIVGALWMGGVPIPWTTSGTPGPSRPSEFVEHAEVIELGELPRMVVSTSEAAADGSVEVVYVRRVLERTRVQDVQTIGVDELGQPFRAAQPAALIATPRSM